MAAGAAGRGESSLILNFMSSMAAGTGGNGSMHTRRQDFLQVFIMARFAGHRLHLFLMGNSGRFWVAGFTGELSMDRGSQLLEIDWEQAFFAPTSFLGNFQTVAI